VTEVMRYIHPEAFLQDVAFSAYIWKLCAAAAAFSPELLSKFEGEIQREASDYSDLDLFPHMMSAIHEVVATTERYAQEKGVDDTVAFAIELLRSFAWWAQVHTIEGRVRPFWWRRRFFRGAFFRRRFLTLRQPSDLDKMSHRPLLALIVYWTRYTVAGDVELAPRGWPEKNKYAIHGSA